MKNRFRAISKSVPDHVIKRAESAMEVDIEVDKEPYIDARFRVNLSYTDMIFVTF